MFDAKPSQPDVEIDLIMWLNLQFRMTPIPKTFKIARDVLVIGKNRSSLAGEDTIQ
jgi:hypothetical protein